MKALQQNTLVTYIDAVPDPRCEGMAYITLLISSLSPYALSSVALRLGRVWLSLAVRKKAGYLLFWNSLMGFHPMTLFTELFAYSIRLPFKSALHDGFPILSETFPAMGWMLSPLMESVFEAQEVNPKRPFIW